MGKWLMPNPVVLLTDVLGSPAFMVPPNQQTALALALRESGFLVATAYYVPDADELFTMYQQLAEVDYHARKNLRMRWVMCGETQRALQRKYSNTKTIHTPNIDGFIAGGDLAPGPEMHDEIHLVMTTRAAASIPVALDAGRLFDMPIRRDPAARRPMVELIPAGEVRP